MPIITIPVAIAIASLGLKIIKSVMDNSDLDKNDIDWDSLRVIPNSEKLRQMNITQDDINRILKE